MDIYQFINSKDIREHCRKLGHRFNTVESAYLVWQSRNMPLAEKRATWREIIETMPDMEWSHAGKDWGSIHRCLERYTELEDRLVEDFFTVEELCDCREMDSCTDIMYDSLQMLSGDKGADKIERSDWYKEMNTNCNLICTRFSVCRRKGNLQVQYLAEEKLHKNTFWSITRGSNREALSQEEVEFMTIFDSMWIYVPTPFQTGDIVVSESGPAMLYDWKLTPENTEYIRRMEQEGGHHDMLCSVRDMAENSYIVRSGSEFYLRLEYHQGEIPADKKFLIALSSYYKSKISLPMLLEAHGLYQKAFDFRMAQQNMREVYAKVALERMGIE